VNFFLGLKEGKTFLFTAQPREGEEEDLGTHEVGSEDGSESENPQNENSFLVEEKEKKILQKGHRKFYVNFTSGDVK
jgi:hypothetical protein